MKRFSFLKYLVVCALIVPLVRAGNAFNPDSIRSGADPGCSILLVDDDNNTPDVAPYFTEALTVMGYNYTIFDVGGGTGNGPTAAEMSAYDVVIWFSGAQYGGDKAAAAGPNSWDEGQLATYLDGGGSLFLSSQDYFDDMGLTQFGQNYLGLAAIHLNESIDPLYGQTGDPVGDGLTEIELLYPEDFIGYPDHLTASDSASVAFLDLLSQPACVDKDGGAWKTVFFAHSWVPIYNNDLITGRAVLQAILDFLCPPAPTPTPTETGTITPTPIFSYTPTPVTPSATPTDTPTITPTPYPCSILLVDDDDDAPDVRSYYTNGLTAAGYTYTVFDVGGGDGNGPDAAQMEPFDVVMWFTGDKTGWETPIAGPNATDEANLVTYLEAGGTFFLISTEYLTDFGLTSFGQNYLGVANFDLEEAIEPLHGEPANPIGGSFDTIYCSYPPRLFFSPDCLTPWSIASTVFYESQNHPVCINVDNASWRTVFFAESWIAIDNEDHSVGVDVLRAVLSHLCAEFPPTPSPPPSPTPDCIHSGDANLSGNISAGDAQTTFQIALGIITPDTVQECAADCNGDGHVSSGDAQTIFQVALGMGAQCIDPL